MFSIIICTYNPNSSVFQRMISSIENQTFDAQKWEWIIVDNNSESPVSSIIPSHLKGKIKIVEEKESGLTSARLKGIKNASNPWLVFVDDDNILSPNFLQEGNRLVSTHPELGAFGGAIIPEFVKEPSQDVIPHLFMLAIRTPKEASWGMSCDWDKTPFGAGMFIRKSIAEHYVSILISDSTRRNLDRKGSSLMSSGDVDMAHTAVDLGFSIGVFPSLLLTHIIPAVRVSKKYMLKMMYYNILSNHLLFYTRFGRKPTIKSFWRLGKKCARLLKNKQWFEFQMQLAQYFGTREAARRIKEIEL